MFSRASTIVMTGPTPPRTTSAVAGLWAWLGLVLLCGFLLTKVEFNTEGTGWVLLPLIAVCVVVTIAKRLGNGEHIGASKTFIATLLFTCYFIFRLLIDSDEGSDLTGFTIGYSNGVVIALFLGMGCRILVDGAVVAGRSSFRWMCCLCFLAIELQQLAAIASGAVEQGLADRQLFVVTNDSYQESGFLLSVMAIVVAVVVVQTRPDAQNVVGRLQRLVHASLAALYFSSSAMLAQFLGSNAGPAFIGPLGVACIGCLLVNVGAPVALTSHRDTESARRIRFRSVIGRAIAWSAGILAGLGALFAVAVLFAWIDIGRLRIFEFGERALLGSSVTARWDILVDNYWIHQCHSPIFGHMYVDRLTTGAGTYVHSLLSLLPHLGVVGALLFAFLCVQAAKQLRAVWRCGQNDATVARFLVLAALVLTWAVLFTAIGNFFTAVQMWFSFGLLVPPVEMRMAPSRLWGRPNRATTALHTTRFLDFRRL